MKGDERKREDSTASARPGVIAVASSPRVSRDLALRAFRQRLAAPPPVRAPPLPRAQALWRRFEACLEAPRAVYTASFSSLGRVCLFQTGSIPDLGRKERFFVNILGPIGRLQMRHRPHPKRSASRSRGVPRRLHRALPAPRGRADGGPRDARVNN